MNTMRRFKHKPTFMLIAIMAIMGLMIGCAGLKVHLQLENKCAIAKEGGYQVTTLMFKQLAKEVAEGIVDSDLLAEMKAALNKEMLDIKGDLKNPELVIDATWIKHKIYDWIDHALTIIPPPVDPDLMRLILKTQDFFGFIGGYEATPEQRAVGMAFCDGVLESLTKPKPI